MKLAVLDKSGKDSGKQIDLSEAVFGVEPNDHAIYLDVKLHLANKRQGTHKAKEKAEITGSTRKLKKQKGTGTARAGSIKSPVLRGGGRIFGPKPRDYEFKLNKKVKVLAKKSALSYKAKESNITILEDLSFDSPKTKDFITVLQNLKVDNEKSLLILPEANSNVYLSSRNLKKSKVITVDQLCTYDLLNADKLVIAEGSIKKIEEILG